MRVCPSCSADLDSLDWTCHRCGWRAELRSGIPILAPALALANDGFDSAGYDRLARLEPRNFWFRWRNRFILAALARHAPKAGRILEVGCGTGFVLSAIARARPQVELVGSDAGVPGLVWARQRLGTRAELIQMDARHIAYRNHFDAIGAFDVLEHIDDDDRTLAELTGALRPGGVLVLTVPQHPRLWSAADVAARHKRRYRSGEIENKARRQGLVVERSTSFMTTLLPAMWVARRRPNAAYDAERELDCGQVLDTLFGSALALDYLAFRLGLSLPAGGSRLVVARKQT